MRRKIPRREPVFVGTEGASEAQFVYFLRDLCLAEKTGIHVKVWQGSGGDSLYVVLADGSAHEEERAWA